MTRNTGLFFLRKRFIIPGTTAIAALSVPWPSPVPAVADAGAAKTSTWWTWMKSGLLNDCLKIILLFLFHGITLKQEYKAGESLFIGEK